ADSSEPTVMMAEVARLANPDRSAAHLIILAASILVTGLAAWSWSSRLASRAAAPSPSGPMAIRSIATRPRSAAWRTTDQPGGRRDPLVAADPARAAAPPGARPTAVATSPRSSSRLVAPAPPPPIPGRAGGRELAVAARTPAPVAVRLPDLSPWTPK